jgi:hypothetical protein
MSDHPEIPKSLYGKWAAAKPAVNPANQVTTRNEEAALLNHDETRP